MAIATPDCGPVRRIIDALGLKYVRSLRLSMELDSAVAIVTEQYVSGDQLDRLATALETKEWVLVPRREWEQANAVPASDLMDEAAGEIDRLRSRLRLQDAVIRSGATLALTSDEREAVEIAIGLDDSGPMAATLRGLLDRVGPVRTAATETVEE